MPASITLANLTITTANSAAVTDPIALPPGTKAAAIEQILTYGSGGTSGKAWVQTTFDNGTTWVDVMCMTFTTSSVSKCVNLSGMTPVTTLYAPTDGTLSDDTSKDGLLGDKMRVKYTTVGTYAGSTTLKVYVHPK